jgi:zinc finger protein DZIP1
VFSQIRKEDVDHIGNPAFSKLFKLSQLSVEYLLYAQEFLENTAKASDLEYSNLQKECGKMEEEAKNLKQKIVFQKKEHRHIKQKVERDKFMIKEAGKNKMPTQFMCAICKNKYFISKVMLEKHYKRRHEDIAKPEKKIEQPAPVPKPKENMQSQINNVQVTDKVSEAFNTEIKKIYDILSGFDNKLATIKSKQEESAIRQEQLNIVPKVQPHKIEEQKNAEEPKKRVELHEEFLGELECKGIPSPEKKVDRTPDKNRDFTSLDPLSVEKKKIEQSTIELQTEEQKEKSREILPEEKKPFDPTEIKDAESIVKIPSQAPAEKPLTVPLPVENIKEATIEKVSQISFDANQLQLGTKSLTEEEVKRIRQGQEPFPIQGQKLANEEEELKFEVNKEQPSYEVFANKVSNLRTMYFAMTIKM